MFGLDPRTVPCAPIKLIELFLEERKYCASATKALGELLDDGAHRVEKSLT